jgi:hypothetical protein
MVENPRALSSGEAKLLKETFPAQLITQIPLQERLPVLEELLTFSLEG